MVMACAAVLLSSCGTRILMTEAVPAKVDLGRGNNIIICPLSSSLDLCEKMENAFKNKIRNDAYYTSDSWGGVVLNIKDVIKNNSTGKMFATVTAGKPIPYGIDEICSRDYSVRIPLSGDGNYYIEDTFDEFAEMVMDDFTPHEESYYVRVKGSSKNPAVKKAALCMRAGDWKQGAQYAMEAVNNDPQDPEAYYVCGLAKRHDMEYGKSTEYFEKAFSLKPKGKYKTAIYKNRQLQVNDGYVRKQLTGE